MHDLPGFSPHFSQGYYHLILKLCQPSLADFHLDLLGRSELFTALAARRAGDSEMGFPASAWQGAMRRGREEALKPSTGDVCSTATTFIPISQIRKPSHMEEK